MKYTIILLLVLLSGCTGCLEKLYSVHEPPTPIYIPIDTKLSKQRINDIIDSVNPIYKNSCDYPAMLESGHQRIIYTGDCEAYLIKFERRRIAVRAICLMKYQPGFWLTVQRQISDSMIVQTRNRLSAVFR